LNGGVHGVLDAELVADIDLMEDDRDAILGGELGNGLVSVVLEDVEDDKGFNSDIAKSIGDAVSKATRTATEKDIVRFETLKGKIKFSLTQ
jgi:hypothetical protein